MSHSINPSEMALSQSQAPLDRATEPEEDSYTLLIVDDEKFLRSLVRISLESSQYHIEEAGDGASALAMLGERSFDLLFLDLTMPGLTGLEVLKTLRERGDLTPVIIMSAFIPNETLLECVSMGVTTFVGKPTTPACLRKIAADFFASEKSGRLEQALSEIRKQDLSAAYGHLESVEADKNDPTFTWKLLLEHLLSPDADEKMGNECAQLGKRLIVQ